MNILFYIVSLLLLSQFQQINAIDCDISFPPALSMDYNPIKYEPYTASTGGITVTCNNPYSYSKTVNYTVSMSTGNSQQYPVRKLYNGSNVLTYNIYIDQNYSSIWGNGTGSTKRVIEAYTLVKKATKAMTYSHYARLNPDQNVPAGTYTDVITITVDY